MKNGSQGARIVQSLPSVLDHFVYLPLYQGIHALLAESKSIHPQSKTML